AIGVYVCVAHAQCNPFLSGPMDQMRICIQIEMASGGLGGGVTPTAFSMVPESMMRNTRCNLTNFSCIPRLEIVNCHLSFVDSLPERRWAMIRIAWRLLPILLLLALATPWLPGQNKDQKKGYVVPPAPALSVAEE